MSALQLVRKTVYSARLSAWKTKRKQSKTPKQHYSCLNKCNTESRWRLHQIPNALCTTTQAARPDLHKVLVRSPHGFSRFQPYDKNALNRGQGRSSVSLHLNGFISLLSLPGKQIGAWDSKEIYCTQRALIKRYTGPPTDLSLFTSPL